MPMNRVQFQPGMSLREFQARYGTEAQCRVALQCARWPNGFRCPSCDGREHSHFERLGRSYWQCSTCRCQTSLTSGTIFDASKLSLTTWFLGMYLLSQTKTGMSALELHRHLGVSYRTAWLLKHKLMRVMFEQERERRLDGLVQVDDAFLGGERTGGKRGRGSENKVPLIAAVQTSTNGQAVYARLDVLPDWRVPTVARWAVRALRPATHVLSDGLSSFVGVKSAACSHEPIIHNTGTAKANVQHARFNAINTLLGNLKMWMNSTFRGFKASHYAARYLAEFQYRFNRRFDLARLMPALLSSCALQPPAVEAAMRSAMPAEFAA
jgi:ribosomal protein L37AE/L43A